MHTCPLYSAFPLSQLPVYPAGCVFPASIRCRCGSISLKAFSSLWINGTVPQCTQALPVPPDQNTDAAPLQELLTRNRILFHKIFKDSRRPLPSCDPCDNGRQKPSFSGIIVNHCIGKKFHHLQRKENILCCNLRKHAVYNFCIIHPGHNTV